MRVKLLRSLPVLFFPGALLLGACASKPPVDSFCEKFQTFDFRDIKGFRALAPHNQKSTLVNDNTFKRDCKGK